MADLRHKRQKKNRKFLNLSVDEGGPGMLLPACKGKIYPQLVVTLQHLVEWFPKTWPGYTDEEEEDFFRANLTLWLDIGAGIRNAQTTTVKKRLLQQRKTLWEQWIKRDVFGVWIKGMVPAWSGNYHPFSKECTFEYWQKKQMQLKAHIEYEQYENALRQVKKRQREEKLAAKSKTQSNKITNYFNYK